MLMIWRLLSMLELPRSRWRNDLNPMVLLVPEVLMMLMKDERRCGFGICLPHLVIYSHFGDFVNFGCRVQAWQLVEPTQAFSPQFIVSKPEASMVDVLSSDTKDLLNSLFFSPACDSPSLRSRENSNANSFKSWPEVNNMDARVYAALSADASSSCKHAIDAPCVNRRSHFNNSPVQKTRKTQWHKTAPSDAPRKRSKKVKVDIDRALVAPAARDGSLSAADFARSKWEIMYPLFVAEGLVDTSTHVNRKDT
jgi:hypothetical protein